MKKIVVLSDSHGNRRALEAMNGLIAESDFVIHLGDTSSDGSFLRSRYPGKVFVLNGNCDLAKSGEDELTIEIEDVKIFACHGHLYSVKTTLSRLAARAEQLGCTIALYGHTHAAREDTVGGVTLLNPGNLTRYGEQSYLYLIVNKDRAVHKIVRLGQYSAP